MVSETEAIKKLKDEIEMHEKGQDRLLRIIGRLTQLCDENGLGDKARAIVSEESRK